MDLDEVSASVLNADQNDFNLDMLSFDIGLGLIE